MTNESATASTPTLQAIQVYTMAGICLVLGLAIGYLMRGSVGSAPSAQSSLNTVSRADPAARPAGHMPTLDDMKRMADKQAAPLLDKLKAHPNDPALLTQIGAIYHATHQFKEATVYYDRAVQAEPSDVPARTRLASSLYRGGDADGAIAQLNRALSYDPRNANALFDLGMIRMQAKGDSKGAVAAWQKLLKTNPNLKPDRKAEVQRLMAEVSAHTSGQAMPRRIEQ